MAFLRTVLFAVLAMAVAIAPAAPCTMSRHAALDHVAPAVAASDDHATRHHHGGLASDDAPSLPSATTSDDGIDGRGKLDSPTEHQSAGKAHEHHRNTHGKHNRMAGCVAACCPLACQAAVPQAPWSGTALEFRASDPIGIAQEDGVADPRPLRIERPPRSIG